VLKIKNSRELITPDKIRLKVLVYGLPGTGKTEFATTAPNLGYAACETGHGKGLLTAASKGIDYVEPTTLGELEEFVSGKIFGDKDSLVWDSLSHSASTVIKDAALSIPRLRGDAGKRKIGVPELDDYGVMAEMTRKLLNMLLLQDKHVIVTATEKIRMPDAETGLGEITIGPELPGQMFIGATALFDIVLRLRTRQKLRIPGDAKSRITERYFLTGPDGQGTIAKCRNSIKGRTLLDREEVFNLDTGQGSFPYLLDKILKGYLAEV
jgi:hypothetical protein